VSTGYVIITAHSTGTTGMSHLKTYNYRIGVTLLRNPRQKKALHNKVTTVRYKIRTVLETSKTALKVGIQSGL